MKKKYFKILLIVTIVITLVAGLSGTYAFFVYRETGQNVELNSGKISIDFVNDSNYLNVLEAYPVSETTGKIYPYYTDFTITSVVENHPIKYEIQVVPTNNNTIDSDYIKVYLTDTTDTEIVEADFYKNFPDASYNTTGKTIYTDTMTSSTSRTFRLRVWIDESYTRNVSEEFGFNVYLYAVNG